MTQAPVILAMKPFTGTPGPLAVAQWLAVREGRPLRLICVMDPFEGAGGTSTILPPRYVEEDRDWIAERIHRALRQSPYALLDTQVEVVDGSVPGTLERLAHGERGSLLVMGRGREGGLRGPLAQQVLHTARIPMLIVPSDAEARPIKRAIVAIDFTASSVDAASHLMPLMARDGQVTLCHVRPLPDTVGASSDSTDAYHAQCAAAFGRIIRALPLPPGVSVDTAMLEGGVANRINEIVAARHADIVVCGRRSPKAAPELLLGSVSARLLQHARVPVLVSPDVGELRGAVRWREDTSGSTWHAASTNAD